MEDIIIIGTDHEAEKFWYMNRESYNVILWLDEKPRRGVFLNHTAVLAYNTFDFARNKTKIIIATNKDQYLKFENDLLQKGLKEYEDFVYYEAVQKEMAIFWGNCQVEGLRDRLMMYPEFSRKYWIYPMVNISEPVRPYIPVEIFNNCRLFIYQEVRSETNGVFYSSQYMLDNLSAHAIRIQIPNLYRKGFGFFPQAKYVPLDLMRETEIKFVSYSDDHDAIIEDRYSAGESEEAICYAIKYEDVFSEKDIKNNFWKYMDKIRVDDEKNDVKIYPYILENYKDRCIFIDPGHISDCVYDEYIRQISQLLKIKFDKIETAVLKNELIYPIYGCVKKYLELNWYDIEQTIRENKFTLVEGGVTIEEYVKEYIFICITR